MDDAYDALSKGVRKTIDKRFGEENNEQLKLIQELLLMDNGTPEFKQRIDAALQRLRLHNLKFQMEIEKTFNATLNESGEIIKIDFQHSGDSSLDDLKDVLE